MAILQLQNRRYLVFRLVCSAGLREVRDLKRRFIEIFSIIPNMPIIIIIPPEIFILSIIGELELCNIYILTASKTVEYNYLLFNALALVIITPYVTEDTAMLATSCFTVPQ